MVIDRSAEIIVDWKWQMDEPINVQNKKKKKAQHPPFMGFKPTNLD